MARKTYIANNVFLSIPVMVCGELRRIRFENGTTHPYRKNGTFTTSDEELQKAMEADDAFGKQYTLKDGGVVAEDKVEEKTETIINEKVLGVDGFRAAQKWLVENKGVVLDDIKTKALLKEKCSELGVAFEDYEL